MKERWVVSIIESERGWGAKTDGKKIFGDLESAKTFVKEFNSENTAETVPEVYWYATSPVPATHEDKEFGGW